MPLHSFFVQLTVMVPWQGAPGPGLRSVSRCPQRPNWLRRASGGGVNNRRRQDGDGGGGGGGDGDGGTSDDIGDVGDGSASSGRTGCGGRWRRWRTAAEAAAARARRRRRRRQPGHRPELLLYLRIVVGTQNLQPQPWTSGMCICRQDPPQRRSAG